MFSILFLSFQFSIAQKETTHWYFGKKAGLDFSSGTLVVDSSGVLETDEGCATISDAAGKLLFYTDGSTFWNRNHKIMSTGIVLVSCIIG